MSPGEFVLSFCLVFDAKTEQHSRVLITKLAERGLKKSHCSLLVIFSYAQVIFVVLVANHHFNAKPDVSVFDNFHVRCGLELVSVMTAVICILPRHPPNTRQVRKPIMLHPLTSIPIRLSKGPACLSKREGRHIRKPLSCPIDQSR